MAPPAIEPDRPSVVVIGRAADATMTLGRPSVSDPRSAWVRVPIRLDAGATSVSSLIEFEGWGGATHFVAYLAGLAEAWRGWKGTRDWTDDHASVSMSATHDGIGLVTMTVSLLPFLRGRWPGAWEFLVVLPIEPGALQPIAVDVAALLGEARRP